MISFLPGSQQRSLGLNVGMTALGKVTKGCACDDDANTPPFCYAYRRRGDYDASFESYQKALELNPHHRGALKYLGEADLELGDGQRTIETLERLAGVCRLQLSAGSTVRWRAYCLEGGKLENAIRVRR